MEAALSLAASGKDQPSLEWGQCPAPDYCARAELLRASLYQKVETHVLQRHQEAKSPGKLPTYISQFPQPAGLKMN